MHEQGGRTPDRAGEHPDVGFASGQLRDVPARSDVRPPTKPTTSVRVLIFECILPIHFVWGLIKKYKANHTSSRLAGLLRGSFIFS